MIFAAFLENSLKIMNFFNVFCFVIQYKNHAIISNRYKTTLLQNYRYIEQLQGIIYGKLSKIQSDDENLSEFCILTSISI